MTMSQTLLLADDSLTIQRVIELTFADEDIGVVAVGDGSQAIERIKADPPDIVLADSDMPKKNGYEVAAFIKSDPALAHIPVVLLTGAFEPVEGDRARKIGCDAVLVKPFEPQRVISRVQELLGRSQAADVSLAGGGLQEPSGGSGRLVAGLPNMEDVNLAQVGTVAANPEISVESLGGALNALEGALDTLSFDGSDPPSPLLSSSDSPSPANRVSDAARKCASTPPTLAEAFTALLAAEQGQVDAPKMSFSLPRPTAPVDVSPEFIDRVTERVIERLSSTVTRDMLADIVSRVAERLVREELGRPKQL